MILGLVNVKGGVGKTTTAVNLAAVFAEGGKTVLFLDLDPQGSASFSFGVPYEETRPSVYEALVGGCALTELMRPTRLDNVHLITSSMDLADADGTLARLKKPWLRVARALEPVRPRYDVIIIDCPPGLSLLSVNGLAAADAYIVPVVPHDLSMEALGRFSLAVQGLDLPEGRRPDELGILLTMTDQRTGLTGQMVDEIRQAYGSRMLQTEIPVNVRLAQAPGYGMTVLEYESWSPGAQAYRKLGTELLRRARQRGLI
jgi:chromosome partitioning protein